jgi:hypothetical protein
MSTKGFQYLQNARPAKIAKKDPNPPAPKSGMDYLAAAHAEEAAARDAAAARATASRQTWARNIPDQVGVVRKVGKTPTVSPNQSWMQNGFANAYSQPSFASAVSGSPVIKAARDAAAGVGQDLANAWRYGYAQPTAGNVLSQPQGAAQWPNPVDYGGQPDMPSPTPGGQAGAGWGQYGYGIGVPGSPGATTWAVSPFPKNMPRAEQRGNELKSSADIRAPKLAEYLYPDSLPADAGPGDAGGGGGYAPGYGYGGGGGYDYSKSPYAWMAKLMNWNVNRS